jgi:hypothetical protein
MDASKYLKRILSVGVGQQLLAAVLEPDVLMVGVRRSERELVDGVEHHF